MQETLVFKEKLKLSDRAPEWLKSFFYSDMYFVVLVACCFAGWASGYIGIAFCAITMLCTVSLVFLEDATPTMPILFFGMLAIADNSSEAILGYAPYLAILAPFFVAWGFHVIYYRTNFNFGKMFFPQVVISIAMVLGGSFVISLKGYAFGLTYIALCGPVILLLYFIIENYCRPNKYVKQSDFMAKALMYVGILVSIEIFTFYLRQQLPSASWGIHDVKFGWGNSNNAATFLLVTAPMCFYLGIKSKYVGLYAAVGFIQYIALVMSFSRGGIMFGAITGVICVVYSLIRSEHRKITYISYATILAIFIIVYGCLFNQINTAVGSLIGQGFGLSGREELYKEAWHLFLRFPIFGAGMGHTGPNLDIDILPFYWFHSTFFQVIGSMGLVGVVCFVFFYIKRYGIIFKNMRFKVERVATKKAMKAALAAENARGAEIEQAENVELAAENMDGIEATQNANVTSCKQKKNAGTRLVIREKRVDVFSVFAFFSFLAFEMYSMMDCGTFSPIPFAFMMMFLNMVVDHTNRAPLCNKSNVLMLETYIRTETI